MFAAAEKSGAAILAVPVSGTLKRADGKAPPAGRRSHQPPGTASTAALAGVVAGRVSSPPARPSSWPFAPTMAVGAPEAR